jgi:hypothetical protein
MKKNVLKVADPDTNTVLVFRSKTASPDSITGPNLTVTVIHESLLILSNGVAIFVYGPGQWVTVNQSPI